MKLISDIPEDVYTRLFDNGIQDNEIAVDDICEMARALRMGTPLSEELRKLKREIHDIKLELDCDYYTGDKITRLIEKHISELKGENSRSEQIEKKCETCKYWNGGYVTFVCCECKNESEWIPELKGENK